MSPLRLWMIVWIVTGGAMGYVVASGIGVVFLGQPPLPYSDKIGWYPIPMLIFLIISRFVFHEELHGRIVKDDKD